MKFTNGAWLTGDGYCIHEAREIRFTEVKEDRVTLTVPTYHISGRGATLGGVFITVEITSPFTDVYEIRAYQIGRAHV